MSWDLFWWEVIASSVDVGGNFDHYRLNFIFIIGQDQSYVIHNILPKSS